MRILRLKLREHYSISYSKEIMSVNKYINCHVLVNTIKVLKWFEKLQTEAPRRA